MNYTYSNSIAFSITLKQRLKNCILVVVSVSSFYTFSTCLWQNYLLCLNSKLMCRQIIIGTYHVLGISDIHVRKKKLKGLLQLTKGFVRYGNEKARDI